MTWRPLFIVACSILLLCPVTARSQQQVYTMEEAVLRALEANPTVDSAEHGVEASESALKAARSSFGPSVNSSYAFTYYDKERQTRNEKRAYTMGVTASQPLFTGFNLLNTYQKAALQRDSQQFQLESVQLSIVGQVQTFFLAYLQAEENIRSTMRSMERAKEQMATAQASFDVGLRPRLDVIQATLDFVRSEAQLIQSENARDLCRARLNTLLNLPVEADTVFVGELFIVPFYRSLESCLEQAFRQRPDLQIAIKSVDIAYKDLGIVHSNFYPQVSANLNWSSTGNDVAAAGSRLYPTNYSTWTAGITLQWNLFSSGRRVHLAQQAKSQIAALESEMQSVFNNAALEIKSCLLSAQDAIRMIEVAERAVISARESYEDAKLRYELQLGTNLDLLTAQSDLADAELSLTSAKADYLTALVDLYVAMGEINPDLQPDGTPAPWGALQ